MTPAVGGAASWRAPLAATLLALLLASAFAATLAGERSLSSATSRGGSSLAASPLTSQEPSARLLPSVTHSDGGSLAALPFAGHTPLDADGARDQLRLSPLLLQGEKFLGSGQSGLGEFGYSIAMTPNGQTALIGAPADNGGSGAVWVFVRTGSTWSQQGPKLTGAGESGPGEFGASVALAANGQTALIGGRADNGHAGAVWVFTLAAGAWTQQGAKLTGAGESAEAHFGYAVALSAEGDTALIGAPEDNGAEPGSGAAWAFTRSGSTWSQQGPTLIGGKEETAHGDFGASVALSADGQIALVGAPADSPGSDRFAGAAWAFALSGSTWSQLGVPLAVANNEDGLFGDSVALSAAGDTALIAGDGGGAAAGAAWVFTREGLTWSQQSSRLTGEGESRRSAFGYSVALSADGNTALVGGPYNEGGSGAAWEFARAGTSWAEQGSELNVEAAGGLSAFGHSVALNAEGNSALIGGRGGAWALASPPLVTTVGATAVGTVSATLNGIVNPEGAASNAYFQYGTTLSYGQTSPGQSTGSPGPFAAVVSGLTPETTYHFRIVAENSAGVSYGADSTFTTAPAPLVSLPLSPSAPEKTLPILLGVPTHKGTPHVGSGMTWTFGWSRTYTTVESLIVQGVPAGGAIEVACHGPGCPFAHSRAASRARRRCSGRRCKIRGKGRPRSEVDLAPLFKGRRLGVGARIAVSILKTGWIGKSFVFTVRPNRAPSVKIACLAPGSSDHPSHGC